MERCENFALASATAGHSFTTDIAALYHGERDSFGWGWYPNRHVAGVSFRHRGRSP